MEAIHGVIDDDENDGEEPKVKRSSAQQKIADLMYLEGKSYGEAYDIVVLGKETTTRITTDANSAATTKTTI